MGERKRFDDAGYDEGKRVPADVGRKGRGKCANALREWPAI
jgi:hypothetical protein